MVKARERSEPVHGVKRHRDGKWYWGLVDEELTFAHCKAMLGPDRRGPFDSAADAALDMVRTWVVQSAARGGSPVN